MNPQTANLDPKLKEAYERVMGTAGPTTAAANTPRVSDNMPKPQTQVVTAKNRGGFLRYLLLWQFFCFL